MNIGILKEDPRRERRIALTPAAVQSLVSVGHIVYVEKDAGDASHFSNEDYKDIGAHVVYMRDEVFGRSEVLLKILSPTEEECNRLTNSQILFSFLHLAVTKTRIMETLLRKHICSIAYELIEDGSGNLPILQEMSEIAGQMSIHIAARYLESINNGRGIVLGGISGVPPALVVVIGAGTVGQVATRTALGVGAKVIVFDKDLSRLRSIENRCGHYVSTVVTNQYNLVKVLRHADVVIGAILMKGERAPHVVSEEMVKQMRPGSIIIDVSIDQGGCIETSRPTTLENPTYILHNVIHYCVPNVAANVARTATYGLTNALLPYLSEIAAKGIDGALNENQGLARGVCTYKGACTKDVIARRFELPSIDVYSLVAV
ncbi:MAG: alanine dehydrogenase [Ignavibacteriae bacterium]|nr:alanine dehydrogenase [Ignavibacteriota bacterium]